MVNDVRLKIRADDKTKRAFRSVQSNLSGVTRGVGLLQSRVGALVGIGGAGGIGLLIKRSIQWADTLGKTADKLGISTTALQEYRIAAELTGVPVNALDIGIQRFTRRLGEAAQGSGVLSGVLDKLNIELRNQDGTVRSTEAVLNDYADAIKNAESPQQQLLLAFKAFDTEGAALVNTLRDGGAGLDSLREKARQTGAILPSALVETATTINDRWTILNDIIGKKFKAAAISAADAALNLFGIFNNLGDVQERLIEIENQLLEAQIQRDTAHGRNRAGADARLSQLRSERAELEALQQTLIRARQSRNAMTGGLGGGEDVPNTFTGKTPSEMQSDLDQAINIEKQYQSEMAAILEQEIQAARQGNQIILNERMNVANQSLALLQTFAGKSKALAIAAIALQKGIAIAEATIQNEVAAIAAGKAAAIVSLNPAAYDVAYARVKALGRISVGLIAATGIAQAAQVSGGSGGGAAAGTPANPISTTSSGSSGAQPFGYGQQTTVVVLNSEESMLNFLRTHNAAVYDSVIDAMNEHGVSYA